MQTHLKSEWQRVFIRLKHLRIPNKNPLHIELYDIF